MTESPRPLPRPTKRRLNWPALLARLSSEARIALATGRLLPKAARAAEEQEHD